MPALSRLVGKTAENRIMRYLLLISLLADATLTFAQPTPTASTAPAPHVVAVPADFQKVQVDGHTAMCQPGDQAWVKQVLESVNPRPRPATMPADMLRRISEKREALANQMASELGLDPAAVSSFFDEKTVSELTRLDAYKPALVYYVASPSKTKELIRGGWSDPRLHYNRVNDEVYVDQQIGLNMENLSENLVAVFYQPDDDASARAARLAKAVVETDASVANVKSGRGAALVQGELETFITTSIIKPLDLKPDQAWLGMGIGGYFSAKYAAPILGLDTKFIIDAMVFEDPRVFLKSSSIDLLHPADPETLRSEVAPYYTGTAHRKSMIAIRAWLKEAGDAAALQTINALKEQKPADGPALVKLILELTKFDLTKNLSN